MDSQAKSEAGSRVLDKRLLQQSVAALQARLGLSHDPKASGEQSQVIALKNGVRPDDRVLSSDILHMRHKERE
jgi:hypothetical protein